MEHQRLLMAKYKYILTVIITLCTITTFAQPAQYTPMTASGYQMKRLKVDSTLHLPSFCGVPTILGSTAKEGALAIDTCGGFLYMWTRTGGWDTVNTSGGSGVNQDLQSVLNTGSTSINKDISLYGKSTANEVYISGMDNNFMPFMALGDSIGGGVYQYTYPRATIEFVNKYMSQKLKCQDSTRSEIYLPVQTIDAIDTLAKLSDVRAVSGGGDFWKTNGTTTLSDDVNIKSDSIIAFSGIDDELKNFIVSSQQVNLFTTTGIMTLNGLISTTDTSTYKPLGIDNSTGQIAPLTSWVGGYDFWKTNGTTTLTDAVNIYSNNTIKFAGIDEDLQQFEVIANAVDITAVSGDLKFINIESLTDTSTYKPLMISSAGVVKQSTSWVGGGSIDTASLSNRINLKLNTADTSSLSNRINLKLNIGDTTTLSNRINLKLNIADTSTLSNRINLKLNTTDTASLSNRINLKLNIGDTTTLSNRINLKLNIADTTTLSNRINLKLNTADTSSLSNRINLKLNIGDTTVFQRKSLSANTFMANNTSATANATAQYFKDTSGTYTGTIAWNGTAPTGGNLTYRWSRIGKMVNINISLIYSTQGSSNSTLTVALPSDAPTPSKPAGLTSALNHLYPIVGSVNLTNSSTLTNSGTRGFLRNNTANNGFEFILNYTASTAANAYITCTYFTD